MSQYCDSKVLEQNWFHWLLSSSVPALEPFRQAGVLWTKVIGTVKKADGTEITKHGVPLQDPSYPVRSHCIALGCPIYFTSDKGIPQPTGIATLDGKPTHVALADVVNELHLLSDAWFHNLDNPFSQSEILPHIEVNGFIREVPESISWHAILADIDKICQGIAMKFKQPTEEDRFDLANEALLQVINKLKKSKLVYIPGKAPVFNLLTTTIHRCMYSIMNRRTNRRQGQAKLLEDAQAGILPDSQRSLRTTRRLIKTH